MSLWLAIRMQLRGTTLISIAPPLCSWSLHSDYVCLCLEEVSELGSLSA